MKEVPGKTNKRRPRNREYTFVSWFFVFIFVSLAVWVVYFNASVAEDFINSPYNTRQDSFADRVVRGKILSSDGQVLAQTNVAVDGTEERYYPFSNIFAHVIGYDSNGKSGLESEANFSLLSSHEFFLTQMKNEFKGQKSQGDTVISSLDTTLQTTAYYALGDRRGAVIVMEPSTGRILAMVSKPDFDPNTIAEYWDSLVQDENDSSLLNRATNGAYPPGSVFKVVTALDYYRQHGSFDGYSFQCEGSITMAEHTIQCYGGTVHGVEDFYYAFAHSCNCSFAQIGVDLGGATLKETAEDLLFNKSIPFTGARSSTFTADQSSPTALLMQTAIGQGDTLVSPAHMCMIVSAVANKGVAMTPTLIDEVVNAQGDSIKKTKAESYKRLFTEDEASKIAALMEGVVESGTASALSGRGYTAAGKTGSAEFNEDGSSHSWFVGYANTENPEIALAVIVENGGTGSEAAVPIAAQIFDAYYEN